MPSAVSRGGRRGIREGQNQDGGEIDGKKIKVVFVDSASCGEEKKGYRNAHANNTFHANNSNTYGRGESGTFRGRREFGNTTMTTNGTHRQQHYGGGRRSRSRSPPPRRDSGTYREEETEEEDAGIRDLVLVRRRSLVRDLVLVLVLVLARESDIAGDTEITSHEDDATVARGLVRRLRVKKVRKLRQRRR